MNEVQVDVKDSRRARRLDHNVVVPNLVDDCLHSCQLLDVRRVGCASSDAHSILLLAIRLNAAKEGQFKHLEKAIDVPEPYLA